MDKTKPPIARKEPKELTAHGDVRTDEYYWMRLTDEQKVAEKKDQQTEEVLAYLECENDYTKEMLKETGDLQDRLYDEIIGRIKQDDDTVPYRKNGYWYYTRYEEGREYPIYCRKKGDLQAPEEIILDTNDLAEGHEYYSAAGLRISPDNKLLAYGEDTVSRRIYTIKIKNLETGEYLPDSLENTTGGPAWSADGNVLFYTVKNKETLLPERVCRHTLGAVSADDETVYEEKDTSYYIGVYKTKSEKYIVIWCQSTLSSDYLILPASEPLGSFTQFTPREEVHEYDIDHIGDSFVIRTNWDATNFRLMATADGQTDKGDWREVVPHRDDVLLEGFELFEDYVVLQERNEGLNRLQVLSRNFQTDHYIDFEEPAYLAYMSGNSETDTKLLRFIYSSLTTPLTTFDYDLATKEKEIKKRQEVVGGHDPSLYETRRLSAPSRDGKQIPISLVYRKDVFQGKPIPLLLYGYGSYGITNDPSFASQRLSLLDRGFAFAIAHIRGSQTLGRQWYEDGKMAKKKNTFYDFIDCAEYLISEGYTVPEHIYALGGSAGGLLMGAVINERPDIFHGIVAAVPFVDCLTTMSDPSIPLTTNEYSEWGNPANKDEYNNIKSYSPYDNVEVKEYPHMLVTSGLFDSQVQYWEPTKWVARLRDRKTDSNMLLLHTNMDAGHGGASGRFKRHRETALQFTFLLALEDR